MKLRRPIIARYLGFAALLCVLGLQIGETLHSHGVDEQAVECLFCKGNGVAEAVGQEVAFALPAGPAIQVPIIAVSAPLSGPFEPSARGPPHHS